MSWYLTHQYAFLHCCIVLYCVCCIAHVSCPDGFCYSDTSIEKRQHPGHRHRGRSQHTATFTTHRHNTGEGKWVFLGLFLFNEPRGISSCAGCLCPVWKGNGVPWKLVHWSCSCLSLNPRWSFSLLVLGLMWS